MAIDLLACISGRERPINAEGEAPRKVMIPQCVDPCSKLELSTSSWIILLNVKLQVAYMSFCALALGLEVGCAGPYNQSIWATLGPCICPLDIHWAMCGTGPTDLVSMGMPIYTCIMPN